MEVEEKEVIESWLRHEKEKRGEKQSYSDRNEMLDDLYRFKKESRAVFDRVERWEIKDIYEESLEEIFVFPSRRWREFASASGKNPTVMEAARRIYEGVDIDQYMRKAVDIDLIKNIAENPGKDSHRKIVLAYYSNEEQPSVFDGNHRATASALRTLRGEETLDLEAFVGHNKKNGIEDWDCENCVPI